jgi:hypothetical protein
MDVDHILATLNAHNVAYLLIGGMNFLLRHHPVLTYDIDIWIEDSDENRRGCEEALSALNAEWGETNVDWGPVGQRAAGWMNRQAVFCLNSPYGAIDVFRSVHGLSDWTASRAQAIPGRTGGGIDYYGLSDEDMLRCQMALDPALRKTERVRFLENKLKGTP